MIKADWMTNRQSPGGMRPLTLLKPYLCLRTATYQTPEGTREERRSRLVLDQYGPDERWGRVGTGAYSAYFYLPGKYWNIGSQAPEHQGLQLLYLCAREFSLTRVIPPGLYLGRCVHREFSGGYEWQLRYSRLLAPDIPHGWLQLPRPEKIQWLPIPLEPPFQPAEVEGDR